MINWGNIFKIQVASDFLLLARKKLEVPTTLRYWHCKYLVFSMCMYSNMQVDIFWAYKKGNTNLLYIASMTFQS